MVPHRAPFCCHWGMERDFVGAIHFGPGFRINWIFRLRLSCFLARGEDSNSSNMALSLRADRS